MIKKYIYIIIIGLLIGQNTEFQISNISVSGNITTKEQDIINFSGLSNKDAISAIDIQNSIKRLWLLNKFEDIQISMNETYKGIELTINVIEHSLLNEVKLSGEYFNFKLFKFKKSKSKLLDLLNFKNGDILTNQKIHTYITMLKEDFIKRNYHNVEISHNIEDTDKENYKNLLISINAGSKFRIKDIKLIVNNNELESSNIFNLLKFKFFKKQNHLSRQQILKNLDQIKVWNWYMPWKGSYNQDKLDSMAERLNVVFKSKGYLDFKIEDYKIVDNNQLLIKINTGNQYYINNINFIGNYIFNDSTLQSNLNFSANDLFDGTSFEIANMNINTLYRDKGYLFTEITPSLIPVSSDSLLLNFMINEKSIVKVNKIIIKGNDKTEENVIRRDIEIFPGEYFSQSSFKFQVSRLI